MRPRAVARLYGALIGSALHHDGANGRTNGWTDVESHGLNLSRSPIRGGRFSGVDRWPVFKCPPRECAAPAAEGSVATPDSRRRAARGPPGRRRILRVLGRESCCLLGAKRLARFIASFRAVPGRGVIGDRDPLREVPAHGHPGNPQVAGHGPLRPALHQDLVSNNVYLIHPEHPLQRTPGPTALQVPLLSPQVVYFSSGAWINFRAARPRPVISMRDTVL